MQKSFSPSRRITRSGMMRYSSSGSRVPVMAVETSAIVRRYWTLDSRFAWVSSRASRSRSTCSSRSSRSRTASRSVATDRSSCAEIASASGPSGPFTLGREPSFPLAMSFRNRWTGRTTDRSSEVRPKSTESPTVKAKIPPQVREKSARHPGMMGTLSRFSGGRTPNFPSIRTPSRW
jgi:hypothetical protein